MTEPVSPLLRWLCEEQADIHGTELAELSGIARQTWSKVRQGKQDLTSDLLWRCMEVIARLRPRSECGQVVSIVKSQNDSENGGGEREEHPLLRIERALSELKDETEENQAMLLMARRLRESKNKSSLINWPC
jgi:transcriptional regulator with XRE-family HTH domain